MSNDFNIKLPNGYSISCENDDAIDITDNAGENVMEAQEEQQKPVTQEFAEYDASEEADEGKEVEDVTSEESYFELFGLESDDPSDDDDYNSDDDNTDESETVESTDDDESETVEISTDNDDTDESETVEISIDDDTDESVESFFGL